MLCPLLDLAFHLTSTRCLNTLYGGIRVCHPTKDSTLLSERLCQWRTHDWLSDTAAALERDSTRETSAQSFSGPSPQNLRSRYAVVAVDVEDDFLVCYADVCWCSRGDGVDQCGCWQAQSETMVLGLLSFVYKRTLVCVM